MDLFSHKKTTTQKCQCDYKYIYISQHSTKQSQHYQCVKRKHWRQDWLSGVLSSKECVVYIHFCLVYSSLCVYNIFFYFDYISPLSLRVTSGLLPRSEPYTRRLEAILLLFIVTYAIKVHIHGFVHMTTRPYLSRSSDVQSIWILTCWSITFHFDYLWDSPSKPNPMLLALQWFDVCRKCFILQIEQ